MEFTNAGVQAEILTPSLLKKVFTKVLGVEGRILELVTRRRESASWAKRNTGDGQEAEV